MDNKMEGVEFTSGQTFVPMSILSDDEKRVLEIYDSLEELQLEVALLRAQGVLFQGNSLHSVSIRLLF